MGQGNLSVKYPREAADADGIFSPDRLSSYYDKCAGLADQFAQSLEEPPTKHNVLILVDLQGVYLGFTRWMKEQSIPLDSGMLASRFAHYLLETVAAKVDGKIIQEVEGGIARKELIRAIFRKEVDQLGMVRQVVDIRPSIELFYAPLSLNDIEWRLRKEANKGSASARRQLADIGSGVLNVHGDTRDYSIFEHFIECMKRGSNVSRWEEGFYKIYVDSWGLKAFDEKEVDTRITIRAVDACVDYEADSICIISSDQDFMPLHKRGEKSGVTTYQADVSKFASPEWVGRKIRELGDRFIPVGIDPLWSMRAICEAAGHDPFNGVPVGKHIGEGLTQREFEALCRLHNKSDLGYQLEPAAEANGIMGVRVIA